MESEFLVKVTQNFFSSSAYFQDWETAWEEAVFPNHEAG